MAILALFPSSFLKEVITMSLFYEGFFRSLIPFFHPFNSKLYTLLQHSHPRIISLILSILQQYVVGEYHPPYFVHLLGLLLTLFYLLLQKLKRFYLFLIKDFVELGHFPLFCKERIFLLIFFPNSCNMFIHLVNSKYGVNIPT